MQPLSLLGLGGGLHGGIKPPEHKDISLQNPLVPLSAKVFHIPYRSRNGKLHRMSVSVGDHVRGGQLLNIPTVSDERQIRAPDSGKIVAEKEILISGRVPYRSPTLVLESDGRHLREEPPRGAQHWEECETGELMRRIARAGIYGMGGGGFPTLIKLRSFKTPNTLIINAAECEPYITADHCLLEQRSDELLDGILVLAKMLRPKRIIIGIEENMISAIRAVKQSLKKNIGGAFLSAPTPAPEISLREIEVVYPTGGEKQLISVLLNLEVPQGKLPADVGILCLNVATVCAIRRAVLHNEVLNERIVTISGNAAEQPRNYRVPLWMPVKDLLDATGQSDWRDKKLLMGGGMMNYPVTDTDMPISPGTNCFLLMRPSDEVRPDNTQRECIGCGLCEQVCPVLLQPQFLYRLIKADQLEAAEDHHLDDCIECAVCDYVCPSKIPLSDYYIFAKEELKAEKKRQMKADRARQRFTDHKKRTEEEARKSEQRRLERRQRLREAAGPTAPAKIAGTKEASADEKAARERKIAMLRVQAEKTKQAIAKWETKGDAEKTESLRGVLQKLNEELKSLDTGLSESQKSSKIQL